MKKENKAIHSIASNGPNQIEYIGRERGRGVIFMKEMRYDTFHVDINHTTI